MFMSTVITEMVATIVAALADPSTNVANVADAATLDSADWVVMGDKASLAMASGWIDLDTAQDLHNIHTRWNNDDHTPAAIAERVVFLKFGVEILGRLARR